MDNDSLFEKFLNKKNEIITPALIEIADDLIYKGFKVEILEGGVPEDLLVKESGQLEESIRNRPHLRGQISIKASKSDINCRTVNVGYVEGQVVFINPKTKYSIGTGLNKIEKRRVKALAKQVLEM